MIATSARSKGKRFLIALGVTAAVGVGSAVFAASPASATVHADPSSPTSPAVLSLWYTWDVHGYFPTATDASGVNWPQALVGPGQIAPTQCGMTYQQDLYVGTQDEINVVVGDGSLVRLPDGQYEDHSIVQGWHFVSSSACPDMPVKGPTFTEWVNGTPECGVGTVDSTRTRTDYTYAWNTDTKVWDETATDTVEHSTVEVDVVACPPDMPKKDPTFTQWFDPEPECGVGTVDSIRSRTDYTYAWNTDTKVWDETATVTVEHRTVVVPVVACATPPVDVCPNIDGNQATVPEGYTLTDGDCTTDTTLGVWSSDGPTPTLTELTLAATGAGGASGTAALGLLLGLGGLGLTLLRRKVASSE